MHKLLLASLAAAAGLSAQETVPTAPLSGTIFVAGSTQPVADVQITLSTLGLGTRTDSEGRFLIVALPLSDSALELTVTHPCFHRVTVAIDYNVTTDGLVLGLPFRPQRMEDGSIISEACSHYRPRKGLASREGDPDRSVAGEEIVAPFLPASACCGRSSRASSRAPRAWARRSPGRRQNGRSRRSRCSSWATMISSSRPSRRYCPHPAA
jgi:hypothetical protein